MRSLISPCAVIDDTTAVLAAVQALGSSVTRLPASPWPASWPEPWPRVSEPNAVTATTAAAVRTRSRHSRRDRGAAREVFLLSRELSVMRLLWECLLCDFLAAIITTLSDSVPSRTMAAAAPSTSRVTPVPPCTATLAPHKIFFWPEIFFLSASNLRIETDWFTTSWTVLHNCKLWKWAKVRGLSAYQRELGPTLTEREKVDTDISRFVQILFPIVHLEIIFTINIFLSFVVNILAAVNFQNCGLFRCFSLSWGVDIFSLLFIETHFDRRLNHLIDI